MRRIVSLLPSSTEIICGLGLRDSLVGVTHECDWPKGVIGLPVVTASAIPKGLSSGEIDSLVRAQLDRADALYTLDVEVLKELSPDLIVTQALCDVCAVAEAEVRETCAVLPSKPEIINLEPMTLEEVFETVLSVGDTAGVPERAEQYVAELRNRVNKVVETVAKRKHDTRTVLLEWVDPPFSCGHWTPEIVSLAGGQELIGVGGQASKSIKWQQVLDTDPDVLIIACCGFNVERTMQDIELLKQYEGFTELDCELYVINGSDYFSRPGPRLVDSLEILAGVLHPELYSTPEEHPKPVHVL